MRILADMEELRFKIRDKGRFGFMDEHGNVVIEPQYVEAEDFYNLFAKVKFNDHYVHIDLLGRLLLKQLYKFIGYFEEDLARVRLIKRWGFINGKGDEVIEVRYDDALDFSNGLAAVSVNNQFGYINKEERWSSLQDLIGQVILRGN